MASEWTVTSYQVVKETTSVYTYSGYGEYSDEIETYTYTDTLGLVATATPTAEPVSTSTYTDSYDDVEYIYVFFDPEDVNEDDIMTTTTYNSEDYYNAVYTNFVQPVTYTAPSSCSEQFTVKTWVAVNVPYDVADQLSAKTVSTDIYTYADGDTVGLSCL